MKHTHTDTHTLMEAVLCMCIELSLSLKKDYIECDLFGYSSVTQAQKYTRVSQRIKLSDSLIELLYRCSAWLEHRSRALVNSAMVEG